MNDCIKSKKYPIFSNYIKNLNNYHYLPIDEKDINTSATVFFSAIDKNAQRKVLIKRFNKIFDIHHEFDVESYALENLNQENIIKPIGIFEDDKFGYIVLPYAEGGDLFDFIQTERPIFNDDQIKQIAFSLISALDKIHSQGFIYRDMKLENIVFLNKFNEISDNLNIGDLLLIDFGSCYIESKSNSLIDFRGTRFYRAPEYIFHKKVTEKYDIFSLGILLYYIAVAYLPYDPDIDFDEYEIKYMLSENNIRNLFKGEGWGNISEEIKSLIQSMLLFDDSSRPSTTELLKNEIFFDLLSPYESINGDSSLQSF